MAITRWTPGLNPAHGKEVMLSNPQLERVSQSSPINIKTWIFFSWLFYREPSNPSLSMSDSQSRESIWQARKRGKQTRLQPKMSRQN
jgi:hypothetical protein